MSHDGIGLPSPYPLSLNTDLHPSPLSLNPSEGRLTRDDQHETNLQQCWDKEIAKRMELTDGYRNVFVLVIKWHDDIDQLGVREEVLKFLQWSTRTHLTPFRFLISQISLKTSSTTR